MLCREPAEEPGEGGGARIPPQPEELADRLVDLEDGELRKPARAGEDTAKKARRMCAGGVAFAK